MPGIYIHIPFCRQACIYCNFYFKTGTSQMEEVVTGICKEIGLRKHEAKEPVETIYFGGGTPSYISPGLIEKIINTIRSNYPMGEIKELTLEANPDDITIEKLKQWKSAGVNRLSIGVQSFHDEDLVWMNRAHNASEAENCIAMALEEGFEVSIDLIFGLPGSTDEKWWQNLVKANVSGVHHLSCYGLTLEENTAWKKLIDRKKYSGPNEVLTSEQFEFTMAYLAHNGWEHYEISNYCRPGYTAKHNTAYWQQKDYMGFGPAAHSYNGVERQWNIADNQAYLISIGGGVLPLEKEVLTQENRINEYLMTGLRTKWGVDLERIAASGLFNQAFSDKVDSYITKTFLKKKDNSIFLTNQGMLYADAIAADLFF